MLHDFPKGVTASVAHHGGLERHSGLERSLRRYVGRTSESQSSVHEKDDPVFRFHLVREGGNWNASLVFQFVAEANQS